MNTQRIRRWLGATSFILLLLWTGTVSAQTFSSGSTGADGAFAPIANTTLTLPPNGVFNFTTVNIPAGVTVTFQRNAANTPVTILASGNVTIAGTVSVNGTTGTNGASSGPLFNPGALGGPGGFTGGTGASRDGALLPSAGQGPGGGTPQGVSPGNPTGTYGAPTSFVSLLPLFGGSGGGGGGFFPGFSGASGGGGGGAIVIASSTIITVNGIVRANGGDVGSNGTALVSGRGSGGAIRLVAPQLTGTGTIQATDAGNSGNGNGRIRLEAFTLGFAGTIAPAASSSTAPGPVTAASNPALINLPTLTLSSVGSTAAPGTPGGSYTTADVSLPQGTINPVPLTLAVTNTPVGTVFTVKLFPQFGNATTVTSTPSTGTFASATASASVTFPSGQVSVLNAFGSFTLPTQTAALFPLIDGEEVDRIMVAAAYGKPSSVTLMTKSGREIRPDQLSFEEQLKVSLAFGALAKEQ